MKNVLMTALMVAMVATVSFAQPTVDGTIGAGEGYTAIPDSTTDGPEAAEMTEWGLYFDQTNAMLYGYITYDQDISTYHSAWAGFWIDVDNSDATEATYSSEWGTNFQGIDLLIENGVGEWGEGYNYWGDITGDLSDQGTAVGAPGQVATAGQTMEFSVSLTEINGVLYNGYFGDYPGSVWEIGARAAAHVDGANDYTGDVSDTIVTVPEPATMSLLGLGGVAMLIRRKRQA